MLEKGNAQPVKACLTQTPKISVSTCCPTGCLALFQFTKKIVLIAQLTFKRFLVCNFAVLWLYPGGPDHNHLKKVGSSLFFLKLSNAKNQFHTLICF